MKAIMINDNLFDLLEEITSRYNDIYNESATSGDLVQLLLQRDESTQKILLDILAEL